MMIAGMTWDEWWQAAGIGAAAGVGLYALFILFVMLLGGPRR